MTNPYFNDSEIVTRLSLARAGDINAFAAALVAAFDLLPDPDDLASNRIAYADTTGADGAYAATVTPFPDALEEGHRVRVKLNHTSPGGGETFTLNSFDSKPIRDNDGEVLLAGMMNADTVVTLTYVAGRWQLDQVAAISIPADGSVSTDKVIDAAITLAKMANLAQSRIIGRAAGAGTGVPTALTPAQVQAAAELVKQTSTTDATAGRLLLLGAFGLGGNAIETSNFDTIAANGIYTNGLNTSATGIPTAEAFWHVLHMQAGSNTTVQIAICASGSAATYIRREASGTWGAWRQLYHQATLLGTVSQSGGVPAGAVIETGSNANGAYIRWADGTQICTKILTGQGPISTALGSIFQSATISPGDWPAAFSALRFANASPSAGSGLHAWASTVSDHSTTAVADLRLIRGTTSDSTGYTIRIFGLGTWF